MKSALITKNSETIHTFPALYKSIQCGAIVLFRSVYTGVVVKESKNFELGDFDDTFISCADNEEWQRLPAGSQVILTQE
jgi:hypothetical protein